MSYRAGLTGNQLKIIAITAMFIDHLSWWLVPLDSLLGECIHILGRIAAPIMCFFIAEGAFYTKDINAYIKRLLLFAVISHLPYNLYFQHNWWEATGILWGMALGLTALTSIQQEHLSKIIKILILFICCILAMPANWSFIPVLWIVSFGLLRRRFALQMCAMLFIGIFLYALPFCLIDSWLYIYQFGIILAVPLLFQYNGKRGKTTRWSKWSFYLFYPLHLSLLYILRFII